MSMWTRYCCKNINKHHHDILFCRFLNQAPSQNWVQGVTNLEHMCMSVRPSATITPLFSLSPLTALTHLTLNFGRLDLEPEAPFYAERVLDIAALPALKYLSLTLVNHSFEQAAADALATASGLTALELLRHVPQVPMDFFEFHNGVAFLAKLPNLEVCVGASFSAETSVSSPRQLNIFII